MIGQLFKSITGNTDKTAFFVRGEAYSYAALAHKIGYLQALMQQECKGETKVGVLTHDDFTTYATIVAWVLSGITFVPIDPAHPHERNSSVISQSGIKTILSSHDLPGPLGWQLPREIRPVFSGGQPEISLRPVNVELPGTAWAYILFTSGTTGIPKGVPITRNNLIGFLNAVFEGGIKISAGDRFMQVFDLTFDLSLYSLFVPLIAGATLYFLPKSGIRYSAAISMIEEHEITHVLTVPSFVSLLRPYFKEIHLPGIQTWLFCGEALKTELLSEWSECLPNAAIFNVYGPTEATIFCSSYRFNRNERMKEHHGIVCIGRPFADVSFVILDENAEAAEAGIVGELCISGNQTTSGYLSNEALNRQAFIRIDKGSDSGLYYKTGDLAYRDPEGDYFFLGRKDSQIKIQGFRVELGEIEHAANLLDGVIESVALAEPDKRGNPAIVLFIKADGISGDKVTAELRKLLPEYMLPRQVIVLEEFPLNINGKIDKNQLKDIKNRF